MTVLSVVKYGEASEPAMRNLENVGIPGAGHIYDGIVKEYNGPVLPIRGHAKYMFPNVWQGEECILTFRELGS